MHMRALSEDPCAGAPVLAGEARIKGGAAKLVVDEGAETVAAHDGRHVACLAEEEQLVRERLLRLPLDPVPARPRARMHACG